MQKYSRNAEIPAWLQDKMVNFQNSYELRTEAIVQLSMLLRDFLI